MLRSKPANNLKVLTASQESIKAKKSLVSSVKNNIDATKTSNCMIKSLKKAREDASASGKKTINASSSNKSLKSLRENLQMNKAKHTPMVKPTEGGKKGMVMVKSIKDKIVGKEGRKAKGKENMASSYKNILLDNVPLIT